MARIKYSAEQEPIKKKHFGYTFIKNAFGESMMTAQRNRTPRTSRQLDKMQNLQKAVRFWRTMPPATKASWESFAATFPQPSKRFTGIPLTGYQLFLKRNHYCFLNAGLLSDFMTLPELVSLSDGSPVFTLQAGLNTVDLTEAYISNFGFIPSPGQWLIFAAVPYSEISGQFFPVISQSIQVLETYIDGFFLNIEMPTIQQNIVYSVYLSKPVNPGQSHKSSKIRYMGCFTTKSFLGLSDTPESYAGQAGKVATVNDDENAIVFAEAGGGGLTCEDLQNCSIIIEIFEDLATLFAAVFPPINNVWLAATTGTLQRSVNGVDWSPVSPVAGGATEGCFRFIHDWDLWICTGSVIQTGSADGLSWTNTPTLTGFSPKKIDYNGQGLAICTGISTTNSLYFSGNGKIWQGLGVAALGQYANAIIYAQNIWVGGSYNNGQANTMAYSYDGITWVGLGKTVFTVECAAIAFGNSLFVAVGRGTVTSAYSADGIVWIRTANVFGTKGWNICFGQGFFLVVATAGVFKSSDGISWSLVHADAGSWGTVSNGSCSFDGTNFSFSSSTTSKYSPDLINWFNCNGLTARNAMGNSKYPSQVQ